MIYCYIIRLIQITRHVINLVDISFDPFYVYSYMFTKKIMELKRPQG